MKQMRLIKPNQLAGPRMLRYGLANLRGMQLVSALPAEVYPGGAAKVFGFGAIVGLKNILPRKIEAGAVVAHILNLLPGKSIAKRRFDTPENATAISQRCLTTFGGRLHAIKSEPHWPLPRI